MTAEDDSDVCRESLWINAQMLSAKSYETLTWTNTFPLPYSKPEYINLFI